jgi:hypothetical protein
MSNLINSICSQIYKTTGFDALVFSVPITIFAITLNDTSATGDAVVTIRNGPDGASPIVVSLKNSVGNAAPVHLTIPNGTTLGNTYITVTGTSPMCLIAYVGG